MADADPISFGSQQMLVNSATAIFPTNGRGGSQGTPAAGFPAGGCYLAEAITVRVPPAGADTVTILAGDGTTACCSILVPTTAVVGQYYPIGGLNGYDTSFVRGISATRSDATGQYTLWFRRMA